MQAIRETRRTELPDLDQFPNFAALVKTLQQPPCQCIWFIKRHDDYCTIDITIDEHKTIFKLANKIKLRNDQASVKEILARIAQQCCCDQFHRDKVKSSGILERLVDRWLKELHISTEHLQQGHSRGITDVSQLDSDFSKLKINESQVRFRRHRTPPDDSLVTKLTQNLKKAADKPGNVYLFTLARFPGMVKIGCTVNDVQKRLNDWARCGYGQPILWTKVERVLYPTRVETLIHFELLDYWRRLVYCDVHKASHVEWFEISAARAAEVARSWASWVRRADPYNKDGILNQSWRELIQVLGREQVKIDARLLLDIQDLEENPDTQCDLFSC